MLATTTYETYTEHLKVNLQYEETLRGPEDGFQFVASTVYELSTFPSDFQTLSATILLQVEFDVIERHN